jgi:hypothetical protein
VSTSNVSRLALEYKTRNESKRFVCETQHPTNGTLHNVAALCAFERHYRKQLLAETHLPIPMKPGRPARCDYEYERNGTANLFMMFAPVPVANLLAGG